MENLELYNKLKSVPDEAKKKITGGRLSGMTDINPMWRIKRLTEEFGPCGFGWKYDITDKRLEKGANDEISAFVQINLFVKVGENWSDAIVGIGGASFVAKEKSGMYQSDECFKMALTDAISVSCKALGVGADVYFDKDRTKYEQPQQQTPPLAQTKPVSEAQFNKLKEMLMSGESDQIEKVKVNFKALTQPPYVMRKEWKTELETIIKNIENGTI